MSEMEDVQSFMLLYIIYVRTMQGQWNQRYINDGFKIQMTISKKNLNFRRSNPSLLTTNSSQTFCCGSLTFTIWVIELFGYLNFGFGLVLVRFSKLQSILVRFPETGLKSNLFRLTKPDSVNQNQF